MNQEQNGVIECTHGNKVKMGLIILFHANVPLKLWIDHLIN